MKADVICEGGGTKAVALIGAISSLYSHGFEISHIAGASAGAITAAITAAGYSPEGMKHILMNLDFTDFKDGSRWKVKRGWDILNRLGAYKGDVFQEWITGLLDAKGIETFGDLSIEGETDPRWRWKLKVIVSDITKKRLVIFPNDGDLFDLEPDKIKIADAVRASMAIPFFFRPVAMGTSYLVDGGMLSNFPIWIFDSEGEPEWPTFGLLLEEDPKEERDLIRETTRFKRIFQFSSDLVKTMMFSHDRRFVRPEDFTQRTIRVPVGDVGTTEFDLSFSRKEKLYHNGKMASNEFLRTWNWDEYREWATRVRG